MNLRVDDQGEEPADVAYEFMVDHGFVTALGTLRETDPGQLPRSVVAR